MPEPLADKVRRVHRAQKKRWGGFYRTQGYQPFSSAPNEARLATARICGIPVAHVKQILNLNAGPQTTRSPGEPPSSSPRS